MGGEKPPSFGFCFILYDDYNEYNIYSSFLLSCSHLPESVRRALCTLFEVLFSILSI